MTKRTSTKAKARSQTSKVRSGKPIPILRPRLVASPQTLSRYRVRHLIPGEVLPFETGVEYMTLDPRCCWVLTKDRRPVCLLVGCDAHKVFIFIRIVASPDSPKRGISLLFRTAAQEIRDMGCEMYTVFLMPEESPAEEKLAKIFAKLGAGFIPTSGFWVAGKLANVRRF